MRVLKKIFTVVVINVGVLLLMLLPVELALRFFHLGYSNSPVNADHVLNWAHPKDYRYTMFTPSGEFGGFAVYFDSLGRRSQLPELARKDASVDATVAFLGDSFVEGLQVPYDSTFIGILARRFPKISFLNYGVTGYGGVSYYLQCRRMLEEHHVHPSAVYMVLYSNDVRDDSAFLNRAVYRPSDHEIEAINGGEKNEMLPIIRQSYIARVLNKIYVQWKFAHDHPNYANRQLAIVNGYAEESPELENTLTATYILKTDSLLRSKNIPFYVTAIPSKYNNFTGTTQVMSFAEKAARWSSEHRLRFIDLYSGFDSVTRQKRQHLFYDKDVHYNAAGHELTAAILSGTIPQQNR